MKTIYKYPLSCDVWHQMEMPEDSTILAAKEQDGKVCVWVLCDPETPPRARSIGIIGTGWNIHEPLVTASTHVDTIVQADGLVWHVFAEPSLIRK